MSADDGKDLSNGPLGGGGGGGVGGGGGLTDGRSAKKDMNST